MNPLRSLDFFSDNAPVDEVVSAPSRNFRLIVGLAGGLCLALVLTFTMGGNLSGETFVTSVSSAASSVQSMVTADTTIRTSNYSTLPSRPVLRDLPSHPADKLSPYMNPAADPSSTANPEVVRQFHDLLAQFTQRQAQDDNFTVRVIDRRTQKLLELYVFEDLQTQYQQGKQMEWRVIDDKRRQATRRLVDKYVERGVPREDIIVRWGRANQIEEAQKRNQAYQAYEIQLAHYLDLSLLPTQMGTVETFNQDDLVSSAGARSRYQMLPWIMRKSGVNEYTLKTQAGTWVEVEESLHPLLTLEPAYLLMRGYTNAVGHEIPGLSAYHTGPGNIYKLYRYYLAESSYYKSSSTVVDAYVWAATEGFDMVREETSFGPFSRGYIPSAYGALAARDRDPLNLSQSLHTLRAQLRPGTSVALSDLLTVLDTTTRTLNWGPPAANASTPYEKFRALNAHFDLPASSDGSVPAAGNVQLVSTLNGKDVRFFLPLGATKLLRQTGLDVIDPQLSFRFTDSTYTPPSSDQLTKWDRRYDALIEDIEHFGFTPENRKELLYLHDKFVDLAEANPTQYRRIQLDIIRTHRRIWRSAPWEELSELTMQVTGRNDMPVQPPVATQPDSIPSPSLLQRLFR